MQEQLDLLIYLLIIENTKRFIRHSICDEKRRKRRKTFEENEDPISIVFHFVSNSIWRLLLPFTWCSMFNQEKKLMLKWTAWQIKIIRMMQWRHAVFFFFHFFSFIFFLPIFKIEWKCSVWGSSLCLEIQVFFLLILFALWWWLMPSLQSLNERKRNKCSVFDQPFLKCLFSYSMRQTVYQRRSTTISNASSQKHKNNKLSLSFSFGQKGVYQHVTMISWALSLCLTNFEKKKKLCVWMSSETKHIATTMMKKNNENPNIKLWKHWLRISGPNRQYTVMYVISNDLQVVAATTIQ